MFPFLALWAGIVFYIGVKTGTENAAPKTVYHVSVDYQGQTRSVQKK